MSDGCLGLRRNMALRGKNWLASVPRRDYASKYLKGFRADYTPSRSSSDCCANALEKVSDCFIRYKSF
jgi:hypothetical protein